MIANPELRDVYRYREGRDPDRPFPASHVTGDTPHRYDYIFASPDFKTESCEYLVDWLGSDRPKGRLSDHAPVEAKLSLVG